MHYFPPATFTHPRPSPCWRIMLHHCSRVGGMSGSTKRDCSSMHAQNGYAKAYVPERLFEQRCLIPANGFYEWTEDKQKVFFRVKTIFRSCSAVYTAMKRRRDFLRHPDQEATPPVDAFHDAFQLWLKQTTLKSGSAIFRSPRIYCPYRIISRCARNIRHIKTGLCHLN